MLDLCCERTYRHSLSITEFLPPLAMNLKAHGLESQEILSQMTLCPEEMANLVALIYLSKKRRGRRCSLRTPDEKETIL